MDTDRDPGPARDMTDRDLGTARDMNAGRPAGEPDTPAHPAGRPPSAPGSAGIGSIFTLAFLVILVPGVAVYTLLRSVGLAIGPAGLVGLLVMLVCLGLYPSVLQRLGWVRRRTRRPRSPG
jgi:hypothetical protein